MRKGKLLLVAPPLKYGSPFNPYYIPLRLAYIASMVKREGFDVRILDMNANGNDMMNSLEKFQPDVVCISCFADNYLFACNLAKISKNFGCFTVLSGLHVTFIAEEVCKENPEVDIVVRGEEEETLVEIMKAKTGYKDFKEILGITYRGESNQVYSNPERPLIQNLDALPFPARDLLPRYEYAPILASRGCFFNCTYCPFSVFWRHTLRVRSPENVVNEIESIYQKYGFTRFEFLDNLFPFSGWGEKLF
ncbi:MAG: B12-binding domain-containing radical SAM protein, partial [Methanosarcinales archaeon]